MANVLTST